MADTDNTPAIAARRPGRPGPGAAAEVAKELRTVAETFAEVPDGNQ